jgi:hypothetical protein
VCVCVCVWRRMAGVKGEPGVVGSQSILAQGASIRAERQRQAAHHGQRMSLICIE